MSLDKHAHLLGLPANFVKKRKKHVMLFDVDSWFFSTTASNPTYKLCYSERRVPTRVEEMTILSSVLQKMNNIVPNLLHKAGSVDAYYGFLSFKRADGKYHRHDILPSYKHNRAKDDPLSKWLVAFISDLKQMFRSGHEFNTPLYWYDGYEADDLVSLTANYFNRKGCVVHVQSLDKDLETVPDILLYKPKQDRPFQTTKDSANEAVRYFMVKGDTADGYIGIKGAGDSAWHKHWAQLTNAQFMADYVYETSVEHYHTMEAMARMLTLDDVETNPTHTDLLEDLQKLWEKMNGLLI